MECTELFTKLLLECKENGPVLLLKLSRSGPPSCEDAVCKLGKALQRTSRVCLINKYRIPTCICLIAELGGDDDGDIG